MGKRGLLLKEKINLGIVVHPDDNTYFCIVKSKIKGGGKMARPIKETPILYGEDAHADTRLLYFDLETITDDDFDE